MYSLSPSLAQALTSKPHILRLSYAGQPNESIAQGAEILSVAHSSSVCGAEQLCCGNVCAASVTVTTAAPLSLTGQTIAVYVGATTENGVEWLPLGVFYVTTCKQDADAHTTTLTAYDALYTHTGGTYLPAFTSQASVAQIVTDLCQQCGITVGTLPPLAGTTMVSGSLTGYPCRELLGYLAMLVGCNAVLDRHNRLQLVWFRTGDTLTADEYYAGQLTQDGTFSLSGLCVTVPARSDEQSDLVLSVGSSENAPSLTNPLMSQGILNSIWNTIGGLTYQVGTVSCCGGFCTEAGDLVHILTSNGTVLVLPAMSVTLTLDGGCQCIISATGVSSGDSGTYTGGLNGTVSSLKADLAEFKQVTAEKLTVTDELLIGAVNSAQSAQQQAQQAVSLANETKQAVMNLSDGTSVYYQDSFPTACNAGDVLFHTGNGGIYRYDGTNWTAHQVGTVSIQNGSITADKCVMSSLVAHEAFVNAINTNSIVIGAANTANSAASTASNAYSTANSAVSTANSAASTASNAYSTANSASSTASNAYSTANNASSTASSAYSTANSANSTANSALSTANSAVSAASNAAKTATNFLKLDSSGIIVGDMTSGTLGGNTQIVSTGVNIRSGSTVLASFESDGVTFRNGVKLKSKSDGSAWLVSDKKTTVEGYQLYLVSEGFAQIYSWTTLELKADTSLRLSGDSYIVQNPAYFRSAISAAEINHSHSGYASSNHSHSGYQQTLVTSTETISLGSIAAGSTSSGSVNAGWSGHTVLGVVGWTTGTSTGNSLFSVPRLYTSGNTLYYLVRNIGSSAYSCTLTVTILYG